MTGKKNEAGNLLPMVVTEGVTVNVLPYEKYEYLMTTKEVANGYGVTEYAIRQNKVSLSNELVEGKHYVFAVSNSHGDFTKTMKVSHNAVLWTKRGIVRLGFAMRSDRAKLFRDWAEELIIKVDEQRNLFNEPVVQPRQLSTRKGNHNRLSPTRLLDIMADVCRIDDKQIRLSLTNKLMGGH